MSTKDFKAKSIRTEKIIGVNDQNMGGAHTLIYSSSKANNFVGGKDLDMIANIGEDVGLFISGAVGARSAFDKLTPAPAALRDQLLGGTTLVGGDLHVSGNVSAGAFVGVNTTGSFNEPKVGGHFVTTASVSFAGTQGFTYSSDNIGTDTVFYVSGSKTVSGSSDRWEGQVPRAVSVFGGDLVVSGTLYAERQVIEVDQTTTGSFLVSGSLVVSQSATFQQAVNINASNTATHDGSFIHHGALVSRELITSLASRDMILLLSGGQGTGGEGKHSPNEFNYTDTAFFVSGAIGNKDSLVKRGTSLFGGDVAMSGSLYVHSASSADGGSVFFQVDSTQNRVTIKGPIGDDTMILKVQGNDNADAGNAADLFNIDPTKVAVNLNKNDVDFRVSSNNNDASILVDALTNQVILGSAAGTTAATAGGNGTVAVGTDVSVYISGTIGGKDGALPKTIVAAGDMVVSGTIYGPADDNVVIRSDTGVRIFLDADNNTAAAALNIYDGTNVTAHTLVETGEVIFNLGRDPLGDFSVRGDNDKALFFSDAGTEAVAIGWDGEQIGGGGSRPEWGFFNPDDVGSDVKIILSGALGGKGGTTRNTTLNAGDFVTSGTVYAPTLRALQTRLDVFGNNSTSQMFILSGSGAKLDEDESTYTDLAFFVSGSKNSKDSSTKGTALFGGDTAVSGTLHTDTVQALNGNLQLKAIDNNADIEFYVDNSETKALMIDGSVNANLLFTPKANGKMILSASSGGEGEVHIEADGSDLLMTRHVNTLDEHPMFKFRRSRGSGGTEIQPVTATTELGEIRFEGYTAYNATRIFAGIEGQADGGTISNTSAPGKLEFLTTPNGSISMVERMVIKNDGKIGIGTLEPAGILDVAGDNSTSQVLFLSGAGAKLDADESTYTDLAFFVSGSKNSKDTSTKGTAVFGGDVVISGTLHGGSPLTVADLSVSGSTAFSGSVIFSGSSSTVLTGSTIVTGSMIVTGSLTVSGSSTLTSYGPSIFSGSVTITTGSVSDDVRILSPVRITGSVDANLGLSGSHTKLSDGTSAFIAGAGINIASTSNGAVTITGTATSAEWTDTGNILHPNEGASDDVGVGGTGASHTTYGAVIFGSTGNIVTKGFISGSLGLSGSLTRLIDGTSYIKAGSNITVTSASNGAITIASTAGGGGGSNVGWTGPAAGTINTTGSLGVTGSLDVGQDIRHIGDIDNKISFTPDAISVSKPLTVATISGSYAEISKIYASGSDSRFIADGDMYFKVDRNEDAATAHWRFENGGNTEIATLDENGKLTLAGGAELIGLGTLACGVDANFNADVTLGNATSDDITFTGRAASHLLPKTDSAYNLGSADRRWANIYTGDLHLRNDKGNWTIQEDSDKLIVINNLTGKKYKMVLAPLEDDE